MTMTWKELKEAVDEYLQTRGTSDDIEIQYIDISFPQPDRVNIGVEPDTDMLVVL